MRQKPAGLEIAGFLPGGMNFPAAQQFSRVGPASKPALAPRTSALSSWSTPADTKARLCSSSGQIKAAALQASRCSGAAMISPAADPFSGEPWTSPLGRKDSKIMLRGQGPVAASFQGPWVNMQQPYASLRGQRGTQDLKIMLRIHALRAGAGSMALLARLIL
ncbi:MAG: hypothetical protein WCW68_00500 [Methanothrix sp.]